MKSLGPHAERQRAAGFSTGVRIGFAPTDFIDRNTDRARSSNTHRACVCQNRYPSPSGWPGRNIPVRPPYFIEIGRTAAENHLRTHNPLAYRAIWEISALRGKVAPNNRGKRTCKRNSHTSFWRRFSGFRPVTPITAEAIWSAPRSVQPSAVLRAKSSITASVSRALPLAEPQAHCQTTSDSAASPAARFLRAVRHVCRAALSFAVHGAVRGGLVHV